GLLARLHTAGERPTIALRADMDALPIHETTATDYASENPGVSHACGHDAHTAILLGTLMVLQRLGDIPHNVAAIFQPAEETTDGAAGMIRDGVLDAIRPLRIHALHVYPYLPSGSIGLRTGAMCASADMFEVEISGHGGHAARPHECTDTILVASHIIQALHHIVSRRVDPLQPAVLTVGHIQGGHAPNVIPEHVAFSGTVRTLDHQVRDEIRSRMDRIIRQTAETWGTTASFTMKATTPMLENPPQIMRLTETALRRFMPDTPLIRIDTPSMGGEDFAEFLQKVPGCLLRLGTGATPNTRHPLHHPAFDIDEQAMATGIGALVSLCLAEP
ncbi:MAG TPA: amidohydrolase, partial [Mariprofundaceae bacterium]|nr:amidohydrolase [Mariprofundaceae bacterium]